MLANMLGLRCCELLAVNSLGITFLCFPISSAVLAHIAVLDIKSLVAADMQAILPEFVGIITANQVCRYLNERMREMLIEIVNASNSWYRSQE